MTDPRAGLRERFRGTLAARAHRIAERLGQSVASPAGEAPRVEVLGELHTLKGEARMLGWTGLATLAHAIEDRLRAPEPDADALAAVLDAILLSLSPDAAEETADMLWRTALEALGVASELTEEGPSSEVAVPTAWAGNDERALGRAGGPTGGETAWVHVSAKALDDLGEALATFSSQFASFVHRLLAEQKGTPLARELDSEAERLRAVLSEALVLSLDLRLTPVEPLLARIAAHARMLAVERGKKVQVIVKSGGTRIERALIDRLGEPLLHLATNAIDHGLEGAEARGTKPPTPTLELMAESAGAHVILRVRDDGKGIDEQALLRRARAEGGTDPASRDSSAFERLFEPGFSTRETIDEISGRGIGLDVVKRAVEGLGGTVSVESELGSGTTFVLSVPAALTQEHLLVVRSGDLLLGLPGHLVHSVEQVPTDESTDNLTYRGGVIPLRSLAHLLRLPVPAQEPIACVMHLGGKTYAVSCQEIHGHHDLIRRPTGVRLAHLSGISGCAHIETGELVLLLDPQALTRALLRKNSNAVPQQANAPADERRRVLIVDDSVVVRDLLTEVLHAAGYQVRSARNGREALAELAAFSPELVLSDIEMPEMDGFRLLEAIRHQSASLPVVLVSARSAESDRARARELGATAYVAKGEFKSESLVEVVGRLLGRRP